MFRRTAVAVAALGMLGAATLTSASAFSSPGNGMKNDRYVAHAQGSRPTRGIVKPNGGPGCKPKHGFWISKLFPGCPGPRAI